MQVSIEQIQRAAKWCDKHGFGFGRYSNGMWYFISGSYNSPNLLLEDWQVVGRIAYACQKANLKFIPPYWEEITNKSQWVCEQLGGSVLIDSPGGQRSRQSELFLSDSPAESTILALCSHIESQEQKREHQPKETPNNG